MRVDEPTWQAFMQESEENLDLFQADLALLARVLEDASKFSPELAPRMFRTMHTLKGTSGFLALDRVVTLAHAGEDVLACLRDGTLEPSEALLEALMDLSARLRQAVTTPEEPPGEPDLELLEALSACLPESPAAQPARALKPSPVSNVFTKELHEAFVEPLEPSVKVDSSLLDKLTDLSEALTHLSSSAQFAQSSKLSDISNQLALTVAKARMQPLSVVTASVPRLARQLANDLDKKVQVQVTGDDLMVDRHVIAALLGPLTHLVRNAVGHGLESPEVRTCKGKPPTGVLKVSAWLESGRVYLDVEDDGAGPDEQALLERAVREGLVSPGASPSRSEVLEFMFIPGVSTAQAITELSGRGVGMDVVRADLASVGGLVRVRSAGPEGTCFRLEVPVSLALIKVVSLRAGSAVFMLPKSSVVEVAPAGVCEAGNVFYREFDGSPLPLVFLSSVLSLPSARKDQVVSAGGRIPVVVLKSDEGLFALGVDEVLDIEQVSLKPVPFPLGFLKAFMGVVLKDEPTPTLVLSPSHLASFVKAFELPLDVSPPAVEEGDSFLLVRSFTDTELLVPVAAVARVSSRSMAGAEADASLGFLPGDESAGFPASFEVLSFASGSMVAVAKVVGVFKRFEFPQVPALRVSDFEGIDLEDNSQPAFVPAAGGGL